MILIIIEDEIHSSAVTVLIWKIKFFESWYYFC